jgi:multisubunit Na+/H+ antiporter MnhB subunit
LWHGINVPLLLSAVAVTLGSVIFYFRAPIRARMENLLPELSFNAVYNGVLSGIDRSGVYSTRLQSGSLRVYLTIIIASMSALVIIFANRTLLPDLSMASTPQVTLTGTDGLLRLIALLIAVGAAIFTVWLRRDIAAVLAMMATGLGVAILFILEPAPDVAMVQIVVDLLATVILVLALTRIPRLQRESAQLMVDNELRGRDNQFSLSRDLVVAIVAGAIVASISFVALSSRPRLSAVTPYYETNAKVETGATDIVGAIIVDYRQLDTLIEISVFAVAGLAAYMLLRYATRKFGDTGKPVEGHPVPIGMRFSTFGIGGRQTSPFIRVGAATVFPVALILAVVQMMYGHDQPGDGFTAGVIISLAVSLWYFVYGYEETRRRLPWVRGVPLISIGVLLAIGTGIVSAFLTGNVMGNVNYGRMIGLPLPEGFYISSSFLFEVSICLAVLGSVALLLDAFGNPGDPADALQEG